jgi:hypothetical protein
MACLGLHSALNCLSKEKINEQGMFGRDLFSSNFYFLPLSLKRQ